MDTLKQNALLEAIKLNMTYKEYKKVFNIFQTVSKSTYEKYIKS